MSNMLNFLSKTAGTFFGVGYFPVAPGTAATAVGIGLAYLLKDNFGFYIGATLVLFLVGIIAADLIEKKLNTKDPGIIVIDEVVGIMISLAALPFSWPVAICGFFLFRAFDMFKIYPINKLEQLPGGFGVMLDDCLAGVYTNIILIIALKWSGI